MLAALHCHSHNSSVFTTILLTCLYYQTPLNSVLIQDSDFSLLDTNACAVKQCFSNIFDCEQHKKYSFSDAALMSPIFTDFIAFNRCP